MSILMEGDVKESNDRIDDAVSDDISEIFGSWRFFKDPVQESTLKFKYKWISNQIPQNLYEHITFARPRSTYYIDKSVCHRGRGRGRGRGRSSGRGSSKFKKLEATDTNSDFPSSAVIIPDAETPIYDDSSMNLIENDHLDVSEESDNKEAEKFEMDTSVFVAFTDKTIERDHPLFGLWSGSFETIKDQDPNIQIKETFFFHSYIGCDSNLAELPSEPSISYSVLGVDENLVKYVVSRQESKNNKSYRANESKPENDSSSDSAIDTAIKDDFTEHNDTSNIDSNSKRDEIVVDSTNDFIEDPVLKDYSMVYGYGCNSVGRFSLVGVYNQSTNTIRCEKRYFYSKVPKKPRRYTWDTSPVPADLSIPLISAKSSKFDIGNESRSSRVRHPPSSFVSYIDGQAKLHSSLYAASQSHSQSSLSKKRDYNKDKEYNSSFSYKPLDDAIIENNFDFDAEDSDDFKSAFMNDEGEIYEGGWFRGLRHGRGICLYTDGCLYEGQWVLGKEQGRGLLMTGDRQIIYFGDFFDGLMHGQGVYNFSNGDQYAGDWKEGVRQGRGDYIGKSGFRYYGDWKDNKRNGKGYFQWPDGSTYDGEWENGNRHGRGVLILSTGFKYDGYWIHNNMEGRGTCIFPSGQEYQGGFKQGLREGRGSIRFSEGPEYEGRFKDDRIDGQGTLKMTSMVPGSIDGEYLIPIQIQTDIKRIHLKAGFGEESHH